MMNHLYKTPILLVLGLMMIGCQSIVHDGGVATLKRSEVRLLLPEFANATDDDHAGRALTELTATALLERKIPLVQRESALIMTRADSAAGPDGTYLEAAGALEATHILIGTVHEYRYKTDLDGDPAVGITLRLIDAGSGNTIWQGSSTRVSTLFASVSSASFRAVRKLVKRVPIGY